MGGIFSVFLSHAPFLYNFFFLLQHSHCVSRGGFFGTQGDCGNESERCCVSVPLESLKQFFER